MVPSVFVSYRRKDAPFFVRHLTERLLAALRPHHDVFIDVDRLQAGQSFPEQLDRALAHCPVVLVVVGDRWAPERLADPGDWVRQEIVTALERGKRVIPVTVDEARLPAAEGLPERVRPLVYRHAVSVRHDRFDADVEGLVGVLRRALAEETAASGGPAIAQPAAPPMAAGSAVEGPLGAEVAVPPGELVSENWDAPQAIEGFRMLATPVTEAQWREVMGESRGEWGDDCPVTQVSWGDAVAFCNALSERAGVRPAYTVSGNRVRWDLGAPGYRLPTEREWEYACRAGTTTAFSWGDDEALAASHAWFKGNSGGSAGPVGAWPPNPWGLYDLHGNVWEWCWTPDGDTALTNEPVILTTDSGSFRVHRGGSYHFLPWFLRSAYRFRDWPTSQNVNLGFRCVSGSRRQP